MAKKNENRVLVTLVCEECKSENYRVNVDLAFSKGLEFDEIIGKSKQMKII